MNKNRKVILIFTVSALLAACAFALVAILLWESKGANGIFYAGLCAVWAFGTVPSYIFSWRWMVKQDFRTGFSFGYFFRGLAFFVPLILSPIGLIFYCNEIFK